jgi:GAF domain-containing protein
VSIFDETDALSGALADLNREVEQKGLEKRLQRVVTLTPRIISACDMAAITVMRDRRPSTDVCTDETTREFHAAQYAAGAGPGLDAFRRRQTYRIASTRTDPRWPEFARTAREHGIFSTLSLPLFVGARAVGALNLYSRLERAFSEEDEELASGLAEQAAVALAKDDL